MAQEDVRLSGAFLDSAGNALADKTVTLFAEGTITPALATDTTDSSGEWDFTRTTPGRYDVQLVSGTQTYRVLARDKFQVTELTTRNPTTAQPALSAYSTTSEASSLVATFGFRPATESSGVETGDAPSDGDLGYIDFTLSNDHASRQEWITGRIAWEGVDVSDGSEDGQFNFWTMTAGTLVEELHLSGAALWPETDAGLDLGTSALGFNDLHLGAGGILNFDNANMKITHSTGALTVAGGTFATAALTATTVDASTDFTIGDTVITDGVITDTSGLQIAAAVDLVANTLTTTGSLQVRTIDYSDGDNAITIADGGGVTFAQSLTVTGATVLNGAVTLGSAADDVITINGTVSGASAVIFEGTASVSETSLDVVNPTADATIKLPAMSAGTYFLPVLDTASTTAISSTPEELNLLDGVSGLVQADFTKLAALDATAAELDLADGNSTIGTTAVSDGHGIVMNHGGTMAQTTVQTLAAYLDDEITAMPNLVTVDTIGTGVWQGTPIATAYIADNSITLDKLAGGTDGNIISYDTSGNPVAVATGNDGQVLTSAGADAVPTFEDLPSTSATALDDVATGDAAANLVTTVGNITIDAQANDADVIIKVDDAGAAVTAVTFDGSDEGNAIFVNDVQLKSDGALLEFGADLDTTLTHTDGTGLTLNSTNKLTFGDAASFIQQSSDGTLRIDGEAIIDLNASTRVDVSGDLKVGTSLQVATIDYTDGDVAMTIADGGGVTFAQAVALGSNTLTTTGEVAAGSLDISGNVDIDGVLETDNLTVGGAQGSDGQVLTSTGSGVGWEDAGGGGGITHASQWRTNATATGATGYDPVVNFEAADTDGAGVIGTAMTYSSGVFTFPTTGIWKIEFCASVYQNGTNKNYFECYIETDNGTGSFAEAARGRNNMGAAGEATNTNTSFIFDVTDVSDHKVQFKINSLPTNAIVNASTSRSQTFANFIRLGDT